jgi:signal transduction histidine kinase
MGATCRITWESAAPACQEPRRVDPDRAGCESPLILRRLGIGSTVALGGLGAAASIAAAAISLEGSGPGDRDFAVGLALGVATPVAVGLYAWRGEHGRFGRWLVALGLAAFLPSLSSSDQEVAYSVGRVSAWVFLVALAYLSLAFPAGRLPGRPDRWIVGAAAGVVGTLYVPTALIAANFPTPAQWTACVSGCPQNAFMLLRAEPAFLDTIVIPVRELLRVVLLLAIPVRLMHRVAHATPLMRRTLTPVAVFSAIASAGLALGLVVRRADAESAAAQVFAVASELWLPAISIGFLIGLLRWRVFEAGALEALARAVTPGSSVEELRTLMARTLSDPTVELAYPASDGAWKYPHDRPVTVDDPGRGMTEISGASGPVVAIVHDVALLDQQPFVEAVGAYALLGTENRRLASEAERSQRDRTAAQARVLAVADAERKSIERDLHDGAQQRLVAIAIRLGLAE